MNLFWNKKRREVIKTVRPKMSKAQVTNTQETKPQTTTKTGEEVKTTAENLVDSLNKLDSDTQSVASDVLALADSINRLCALIEELQNDIAKAKAKREQEEKEAKERETNGEEKT